MKKISLLFILSLSCLAGAAHASKTVLPDACGADSVKFSVTTQKPSAPPPPPVEGKAQLVFVEMSTKSGGWSPFAKTEFTTRFGVDGSWVGAISNKSYFTLDVAPGLHHLCSSVQQKKDMIAASSLTTEAGKVYYFELTITNHLDGQGFNHYAFAFSPLEEDEGKFRMKALDLATATPQP